MGVFNDEYEDPAFAETTSEQHSSVKATVGPKLHELHPWDAPRTCMSSLEPGYASSLGNFSGYNMNNIPGTLQMGVGSMGWPYLKTEGARGPDIPDVSSAASSVDSFEDLSNSLTESTSHAHLAHGSDDLEGTGIVLKTRQSPYVARFAVEQGSAHRWLHFQMGISGISDSCTRIKSCDDTLSQESTLVNALHSEGSQTSINGNDHETETMQSEVGDNIRDMSTEAPEPSDSLDLHKLRSVSNHGTSLPLAKTQMPAPTAEAMGSGV